MGRNDKLTLARLDQIEDGGVPVLEVKDKIVNLDPIFWPKCETEGGELVYVVVYVMPKSEEVE